MARPSSRSTFAQRESGPRHEAKQDTEGAAGPVDGQAHEADGERQGEAPGAADHRQSGLQAQVKGTKRFRRGREVPVDARRMSRRLNQAHPETAKHFAGKLADVFAFPKADARLALMAA